MNHDILSDLLRSVRLRGAVYYQVKTGKEWVAEAPASRDIAGRVMPGSEHVMNYHIVTRGQCWGAVVGRQPIKVEQGDVILFPHGDPHVLSSAPGMRGPLGYQQPSGNGQAQPPFVLQLGDGAGTAADGSDAENTLVCGFLGCDLRPFNPLVHALPQVLHLKASSDNDWVVRSMHHAVLESQVNRPGSLALLERISEAMFIDAMCRYAATLPEGSGGWFGGLRDRFTGRVLSMIHAAPEVDWTVDELGRQVGLSRSALHERFLGMVGQTPMQYLANWRMQVAAGMLRNTNRTIAVIAQEVGYDSDAAFTRAFKRLVGKPPADWRREQKQLLQGQSRNEKP